MLKYFLFSFSCIITLLLSGCFTAVTKETPVTRDFFAMDTYIKIILYEPDTDNHGNNANNRIAEKAADAAQQEMLRLDGLLSSYNADSEICALQKKSGAVVSEDTAALLTRSVYLHAETGGAFDITLNPVSKLWGFPHGPYRIPEEAEIKNVLSHTGMSKIHWNPDARYFSKAEPQLTLDFGGIAKGYAAEKMAAVLKASHIRHALLNLGGNVKVIGSKPDNSPWRVALRHPDDKDRYLGILSVKNKSVVTSGDYERYFIKNNKRYHHILNPKTGAPSRNGLRSATIICEDCTLADGLSTALFVMGPESATSYWKKNKTLFDFILFTEDNKLLVSGNLIPLLETQLNVTPVR